MALSFVGHSIESFMKYVTDYDKKNPPTVKNKDDDSSQVNANSNKKDTVEISYKDGFPTNPLPIENYNDLIKLMPKGSFVDLRQEVETNLSEYFSNPQRDVGEIKKYYKEVLEGQGMSCLQRNYDLLLNSSVTNAYAANSKQGDKIAKEYGHIGDTDYVYYDSDYHYALEEAKDILKELASEMAKEHDVDINLNGTEKHRNLRVGKNYSFNETWAMHSSQEINGSTLIDKDKEPPKDFKMFYKESKHTENRKKETTSLELQKGILRVSMGEWSKEIDIPFNGFSSLGSIKEFFNGGDLIFATKNDLSNPDEFNSFMKNFDFYTRGYGYFNGLWKNY